MNTPLQAFYFRDFPNAHLPEILEEIYLKNIYQQFLLGKSGLTIVDIGANIGLTSYYFKNFAKVVYAIEPSQQHFETLHAMVEFNKIKNIYLVNIAISNENGKTKFYHNDNSTMFSMESVVNKKDDFEEVDTMTLDKFMQTYKIDHIDLLKLDAEGSESKIITSDGFKKVAERIKVIVFEHHNWDSQNPLLFQHTLEDLGFEVHWNHNTAATTGSAVRI